MAWDRTGIYQDVSRWLRKRSGWLDSIQFSGRMIYECKAKTAASKTCVINHLVRNLGIGKWERLYSLYYDSLKSNSTTYLRSRAELPCIFQYPYKNAIDSYYRVKRLHLRDGWLFNQINFLLPVRMIKILSEIIDKNLKVIDFLWRVVYLYNHLKTPHHIILRSSQEHR